MKYKIGDVSRMLKISDQMIRYYEKCGVIRPERSGDGKYRYYSEMDIFMLFEAMKYKEWGINIADIRDLVSGDYTGGLLGSLDTFEKKLTYEIGYKQILASRIRNVGRRLKKCRYNTGNVWADVLPAHVLYYLGESEKDDYRIDNMDDEAASMIYSSEYISFFDPAASFEEDRGVWWYMIEEQYYRALHLKDMGRCVHVPEQYVLTTVIDMGEIGTFGSERLGDLYTFASEHNYEVCGKLQGILIGRGNEGNRFRRMMQVMLPLKSL